MDLVEKTKAVMREISDLKQALKEAEEERSYLLAELMKEGITDLGDGYKVIRSESYSYDVEKARELIPNIYDALVDRMVSTYDPTPSKTELEEAIKHLPKEQREAVMTYIRDGDAKVSYTIRGRSK
jgi:hypothetical protein